MPGSNCSIFGCNTSRRHKGIAIFRLPNAKKDEETAKWSKEMLSIITRDRVMDDNLKKMIEKNNVFVCEKHFREQDIYHCKFGILL